MNEPEAEPPHPALSPEILELRAQIGLGMDAQLFVDSPLGKAIFRKSSNVIDNFCTSLADVSPTDTAEIIRLQVEIKAMKRVQEFFLEYVGAGQAAEQAFMASEATDTAGHD